MKLIPLLHWMIIILFILCSCEEGDTEPIALNSQEIAGTYGTVRFLSSRTPPWGVGFNLKIEPISDDSIVLRGEFAFYTDSILANIKGDSIIIPSQSFSYINQSPGGSTWTEYASIKGFGHYDRDKHWISLTYNNHVTTSDWFIEGVKEDYLDLTGYYTSNGGIKVYEHRRPPSIDDRLEIEKDPTSDSLLVSFIFDYQDHVDSALQHFKVPFVGGENEFILQVDSINSLEVNLSGNGEYVRLDIGRISTEPFGYWNSFYIGGYYRFGGFLTAQN
jgi:hypothetical protein